MAPSFTTILIGVEGRTDPTDGTDPTDVTELTTPAVECAEGDTEVRRKTVTFAVFVVSILTILLLAPGEGGGSC